MDKWVCPNDRQLALRAKLGAGWSVHTNKQTQIKKQEQLSLEEQEQIMNVIMRADMLEQIEQERIGRLVEKLDNMKKNAMGDGAQQCILCGDGFGMLGASPTYCDDCKKAVCTKCGIDTFNSHHQPLWLCKICSENRELWKRSGAWFFKGLPKYTMPTKRPSKYRSCLDPNTKTTRANGDGSRQYDTWKKTRRNPYHDSSDQETESGSEDDEVRLGRKQHTTTESDGQSLRSESTTYDERDYQRSVSSDYSRADSRSDSHDYDRDHRHSGAAADDYNNRQYHDEAHQSSSSSSSRRYDRDRHHHYQPQHQQQQQYDRYDSRDRVDYESGSDRRYDRMDSNNSSRSYRSDNRDYRDARYQRQDSARSAPAMYERQDSHQDRHDRHDRRDHRPAPGSYDDW